MKWKFKLIQDTTEIVLSISLNSIEPLSTNKSTNTIHAFKNTPYTSHIGNVYNLFSMKPEATHYRTGDNIHVSA